MPRMGIAHRSVAELRCTFVVWDGDVMPDEWAANFERVVKDPAFASCPKTLADLSTVGETSDITDDVISEMVNRWRTIAPDRGYFEWAFIPNGVWAKARQAEAELETVPGIRTMVFNHADTACVWLGIDPKGARRIIGELRDTLRAAAS